MLNELLKETEKYAVHYSDVQFPLIYRGDKFQMGQTVFDGFSPDGVTYILYRLGEYVDRKKAYGLYKDDKESFATYVSLCHDYQVSEKLREARRERLVAALVTERGKTLLWGLLTNYTPVAHRVVLDKIAESGLPSSLTYTRFSPKEMILFFRAKYLGDSTTEFGLTVRNGETGHAALSYLLSVRNDDYLFTFPTSNRRRHLSRVGEIDLDILFDTVKDIELRNKLEITPVSTLRLNLKDYPDVLYDEIFKNSSRSIAKTIPAVLAYRYHKGLKTAATRLADEILRKADA